MTGRPAVDVVSSPPRRPDGSYPPVFRIVGHDGVYEVRTSAVGQFAARIEAGARIREGFYPALPPCPASVLARIVGIFRERPETEALVSLVYDTEDAAYILVWQGEKATAHSVAYVPLMDDERRIVVAEIHSHHTMDAYFSRTDDASERALKLYGVIGNVDRERPAALFRFPCGTLPGGAGEPRFVYVRTEDIFAPAADVWRLVDQPLLPTRAPSLVGLA